MQSTLDKGTVFYKNKNSDNYINNLRLQLPTGVKVITSKESISQNIDNTSGQYSINNNYVFSETDDVKYSFNHNKGYVGHSHSVRSSNAIENYEMPLNMFNKSVINEFINYSCFNKKIIK